MRLFRLAVALLVLVNLGVGRADLAFAEGNGGKKPKADKVQGGQKAQKGPGSVPPGQIKRYTRGSKLPSDLSFEGIDDLSKWNLKPPGKGNRYIRVGDEILEVTQDLSTVVDAVGIV